MKNRKYGDIFDCSSRPGLQESDIWSIFPILHPDPTRLQWNPHLTLAVQNVHKYAMVHTTTQTTKIRPLEGVTLGGCPLTLGASGDHGKKQALTMPAGPNILESIDVNGRCPLSALRHPLEARPDNSSSRPRHTQAVLFP